MDLTQLRSVLSQLNRASVTVLFVRTYGFLDDQSTNFALLKSEYPNISIVDDRCLCPPEFDVSTFSPDADLTLFSTGYSKFVELGRGGPECMDTHLGVRPIGHDKDLTLGGNDRFLELDP